jgi:hypothetical protein
MLLAVALSKTRMEKAQRRLARWAFYMVSVRELPSVTL